MTELSQWPEAEILMEMPGFGPLVSLAVLSHLDDPHRFKRSCQVASYSGLVPSSRNSAEVVRQGGITHQGSAILRHQEGERSERGPSGGYFFFE